MLWQTGQYLTPWLIPLCSLSYSRQSHSVQIPLQRLCKASEGAWAFRPALPEVLGAFQKGKPIPTRGKSVFSTSIRVTLPTATSIWGMMELLNRLVFPNTCFQFNVIPENTLSRARQGERKAPEYFKSQWDAESWVFSSQLGGVGCRLTVNRNGAYLSPCFFRCSATGAL